MHPLQQQKKSLLLRTPNNLKEGPALPTQDFLFHRVAQQAQLRLFIQLFSIQRNPYLPGFQFGRLPGLLRVLLLDFRQPDGHPKQRAPPSAQQMPMLYIDEHAHH